jgi:Fur family ferric uptake transcriptional regulator
LPQSHGEPTADDDTEGVGKHATSDDSPPDFTDVLSAHGLRRTQPRVAVLSVLRPADTHLSVNDIHHRLIQAASAETPPPDLATVYRTVGTLVEHGVLHALAIEGGVSTYGMAHHPHHHAVCTACGTIIEVPAPQLTAALQKAIEGSAFHLSEQAGLTLHGLCPQCQVTH